MRLSCCWDSPSLALGSLVFLSGFGQCQRHKDILRQGLVGSLMAVPCRKEGLWSLAPGHCTISLQTPTRHSSLPCHCDGIGHLGEIQVATTCWAGYSTLPLSGTEIIRFDLLSLWMSLDVSGGGFNCYSSITHACGPIRSSPIPLFEHAICQSDILGVHGKHAQHEPSQSSQH